MTSSSKLYVIVRSTLSAGLKAAQACHAMHAFIRNHPEETARWEHDNNIVVLEYPDLPELAARLDRHGFALARFHEPDMDDALTAICVSPSAQKMLARVPLAGAAM